MKTKNSLSASFGRLFEYLPILFVAAVLLVLGFFANFLNTQAKDKVLRQSVYDLLSTQYYPCKTQVQY